MENKPQRDILKSVWFGDIEEGRSSEEDWKDRTPIERFLEADRMRSAYHNGQAGLNARLERVIKIVDMPEY